MTNLRAIDPGVRTDGVAIVDAVMPHKVGNVMRMIRMAWEPRDMEKHATWSRDTIVPVMRRVPGYLSYVVAANRGTGRAVAMSTYHDGAFSALLKPRE